MMVRKSRGVQGRQSRIVDVTGRKERLSWEARAEEVSFNVFPKRYNRGTIFYMERERVPKGRGIVTEGVRKVFHRFVNSATKGGGLKELEFRGTSPCVSGGRVGWINYLR